MKTRWLAAFILLFAPLPLRAQGQQITAGPFPVSGLLYVCPVPSGGTPCPSPVSIFSNITLTAGISNPIVVFAQQTYTFYAAGGQYTLEMPASGYQAVVGGGGGASSPSSLTTFFNKYYGKAPEDFGAFGDWHWCYDGNSTGGTNFTSTSCAGFTLADQGKVIDIPGAGTGGVTLHTTIAIVTNSTTIVLGNAITPGSLTNVKFGYGHNDNTAVQNWCAYVQNGNSSNVFQNVHGGYLTKWYYITQTCIIINPLGALGFNPKGFGSPEPFTTGENANEALMIWGTGGLNSGFAMAPQGTFNWGSGSANTGVLYYEFWNGVSIQNFGIIGDSGSTYNTSADTGAVGGLVSDGNGHENAANIEIEFLHNTTSTLQAHVIQTTCFESTFTGFTLYRNDQNGAYGQGVTGSGSSTWEQCVFDKMIWEGWTGGVANVVFYAPGSGSSNGSTRITSSRILGTGITGTGGELAFSSSFSTAAGEDFVIENTAIEETAAANYNIAVNNAAVGRIRLNNVTLTNTTSSSSTNLISNGALMTISQTGGAWNCSATCVNGITNPTGGFIFAWDVLNVSGRAGLAGTGATSIAVGAQNAVAGNTGWAGQGFLQAGTYGTFTNCAVNSVSPAACGSAASGAFVVPTTTTTYTVNTTAVTAASRINVTAMSFAGNLPSSPTCVVPTTPFIPTVSAISAGVSFTLTLPSTTGQTCWQYQIVN